MDIEKLIERLEAWNEQHLSVVCGNGHFACDYLCENEDCVVVRAAAALSTLQAENEKLREKIEDARLEGYAKGLGEMSEENERLWAELEQVKRTLATMWFAYVNSDKETPHSYETDAIEEAERILGPWEECMPKYLWRGQKED